MPVGLLPDPYYWWEAGAMFGQMIEYWYYTGDTTYNDVTMQGMLAQTGPNNDYMPPNQTKTEGNDDQAFWAFAALSAAEFNFPAPPAKSPSWLALAQAVFNLQVSRWDTQHCGGGLRWQIFSFNNGYDYKNSISNGGLFQLAARLARYTGNQTYADWAEKVYDWEAASPLLTDDYLVYDGAEIDTNCTQAGKLQWTYNIGTFLMGAANMYNYTNGDQKWQTRVQGMLKGLEAFFPAQYGGGNIMVEIACEPQGTCNYDQPSFKAYLSRWMAATTQIAPFTTDTIMPKLKTSAQGAAGQCSGGSNGKTCGRQWYSNKWDGKSGVGEEMSALSVIQANLISKVGPPKTAKSGGTSKGDPSAGSGGDNPVVVHDPSANMKITAGDRAGADIYETSSETQKSAPSFPPDDADPAPNPTLPSSIPRHIPQHLTLEGARSGRSPTPEPVNTAGSSPSAALAGVTLDGDGDNSGPDTVETNKRRGSLASSGLRGDTLTTIRSLSPAKRSASAMHNGDVNIDNSQENEMGSATRRKSKSQGSRHKRELSVDMLAEETGPQEVSATVKSASMGEFLGGSPTLAAANADIPRIEEQIQQVTSLCMAPQKEGEKGYIVANHWLARVLARGSDAETSNKYGKQAREGPIGPVDNSGLNLVVDPSTSDLRDERGDKFVPLRPGLSMGDDFEILPEAAWDLIIKWYRLAESSPIITRYCHNTSISETGENIQYELHPPIFTVLKLPSYDGTTTKSLKERDAAPVKMLASRAQGFQTFLKQAKERAGIDMESKVRVWKIFGGLEKGAAQNGMMTPAASRSNSPAPGAIATVDPGDRLVIDLNTFVRCQLGSQRELLDATDCTADEKYNGHATLDLIGLRQDEVIVLEERVGGPGGGHYPSENGAPSTSKQGSVPISITKSGTTAARNSLKPSLANSRSTSPAATGVMTRGRQVKNGRSRGTVGLSNLGNTCYMNSALQCVRSVNELTNYFLKDKYKDELNPQNPLSHNGQVARSYAHLLHEIYGSAAHSAFTPRNFKNIIGKYGPSFSGYQQQDSQEFLLFLLDGLQEDLNRIHQKPYIEKPDSTDAMVHDKVALAEMAEKCWSIYKARNDSVITDLFAGMYKSTVVCPVCDKVSIIFDPFNNLTLQLPIENTWSRKILTFPLDSKPLFVSVDLDKNATFGALKEFVAARLKIDPKRTVCAELYKSSFYRVFKDSTNISDEHLAESDTVAVWEFSGNPTNYPTPTKKSSKMSYYSSNDIEEIPDHDSPAADKMLVPVFHRRLKGGQTGYRQNNLVGAPNFITVDRDEGKDYDTILRKVLARVAEMTTRDFLQEEAGSEGDAPDTVAEDSDVVLMNSDEASEPQAKSLESEDGIVDISVANGEEKGSASSNAQKDASARFERKPVAPILRPGAIITPAMRNLFEMKIVPASKTMIPAGISCISEERRDYPLLSSRRLETSASPKMKLKDKIQQRQSIANRSPPTSDEDVDDVLPSAENQTQEPQADSESDDGLPPIEQIVQPKIPPSAGFGTFNRSSPRNRKGLITYSRKDRTASKQKPSRETTASREATPTEHESLLRLGESILVEWHPDTYDTLFAEAEGQVNDGSMRGAATWEDPSTLPDEELEEKRRVRSDRRKNGVTLDDCLDEFGKPEILSENDAWYCPRCKEHRRASKTFELWKAPDILVIHLKRFSAQGRFRDKLDVQVDFPTEGLDLSTRLAVPEKGKSCVYDLFAVDNHYGGLGGGHYTAYAQNFVDNEWYEYNDGMVTRCDNPQAVVTTAAYLLFYRRRSSTSLGGPFFEQFMTTPNNLDCNSQPNSRLASPAGEGKRLDGSSRNGSSSALRGVGAAHQAGDGGSLDGTGVLRVRKGIDDDDPVDSLPAYSMRDPRGTLNPRDLHEQTLESMEMDEDEGIGLDDEPRMGWTGPLQYENPTWAFGSNGRAPVQNSPRVSGEDGDAPEEDLFADNSSTKVAKSSDTDLSDNRLADFNDDEGTTSGVFGTPPQDMMPLLDVPPAVPEAEQPVAEVMLEDEFAHDFDEGPESVHNPFR
ncbi:hypothetical protein ACLMJK_004891 [Lecanora helva]